MPRKLLATLLLVLLLTAPAARSRAAAPPDYAGYQGLLNRYVVPVDPHKPSGDTRFDYGQLYVDEHIFRLHRAATLERIHAELLAVRPSQLVPADRLAWAINTYNFLVVERATLHLLIPRKKFMRYRAVEEMRSPEGGFFEAKIADVEGLHLSLAEFERRFLDEDTTATFEPRRHGVDPRRALALCSGHLGDPPLAPRAYRGDSLEAQLDEAARRALALPRFVTFDESRQWLAVSDYLAARAVDHGGTVDGIVPFLERYAPGDVRRGIRKFHVTRIPQVIAGDRALNIHPPTRSDAGAQDSGTN